MANTTDTALIERYPVRVLYPELQGHGLFLLRTASPDYGGRFLITRSESALGLLLEQALESDRDTKVTGFHRVTICAPPIDYQLEYARRQELILHDAANWHIRDLARRFHAVTGRYASGTRACKRCARNEDCRDAECVGGVVMKVTESMRDTYVAEQPASTAKKITAPPPEPSLGAVYEAYADSKDAKLLALGESFGSVLFFCQATSGRTSGRLPAIVTAVMNDRQRTMARADAEREAEREATQTRHTAEVLAECRLYFGEETGNGRG